jgi:hypothetical protein
MHCLCVEKRNRGIGQFFKNFHQKSGDERAPGHRGSGFRQEMNQMSRFRGAVRGQHDQIRLGTIRQKIFKIRLGAIRQNVFDPIHEYINTFSMPIFNHCEEQVT